VSRSDGIYIVYVYFHVPHPISQRIAEKQYSFVQHHPSTNLSQWIISNKSGVTRNFVIEGLFFLLNRIVLCNIWQDHLVTDMFSPTLEPNLTVLRVKQSSSCTWCTSFFCGNIEQANTSCTSLFRGKIDQANTLCTGFFRDKIEKANTWCTSLFRGKIQQANTWCKGFFRGKIKHANTWSTSLFRGKIEQANRWCSGLNTSKGYPTGACSILLWKELYLTVQWWVELCILVLDPCFQSNQESIIVEIYPGGDYIFMLHQKGLFNSCLFHFSLEGTALESPVVG
jgi:hypothetical protein